MTKIEKARLFIDTFKWGEISRDVSYVQLTLSFSEKGRWLTDDEKLLLQMLGAVNVYAVKGGF